MATTYSKMTLMQVTVQTKTNAGQDRLMRTNAEKWTQTNAD